MIMLKTITPIDNSIYVEREYATPQTIENTLMQSKKSFHDWRQTSLSERKKEYNLIKLIAKIETLIMVHLLIRLSKSIAARLILQVTMGKASGCCTLILGMSLIMKHMTL